MFSDDECYRACDCSFSMDEAFSLHNELCAWLCGIDDKLDELKEMIMDKKIKQMQKGTQKLVKQEGELLKEDKKRDKVCDMSEKMMKKDKKK